jgi:LmbE family N-acetylglucosaminyl deacetylase
MTRCRVRFVRADLDEAAARLAALIREERADVLLLRPLRLVVRYDLRPIQGLFSPLAAIAHRVNVCRYAAQKRHALAAHTSFVHPGGRTRPLARVMLALPVPVFALLFGREWFVEPGAATTVVGGDILG